MTNTTGVLHILTGTYELLPLRNLNGQAARRGLEIHFPRYQFQHEPDQGPLWIRQGKMWTRH